MQTPSEIDLKKFKIAVVGAGSWGTAIADLLAYKGYQVDLWVFEKEVRDHIEKFHENKLFLPDHMLAPNLSSSNDLAAVVSDKNLIVIVVPSHVMRAVTQKMAGHLSAGTIITSASKGIEQKTHLTMSGVIKENLPEVEADRVAVDPGIHRARPVLGQQLNAAAQAHRDITSCGNVDHR